MDWQPITENDFMELFEEEYTLLNEEEKTAFDKVRTPFRKAFIHRSDEYGDEGVYVVAQLQHTVIYYDDVEDGFTISSIDQENRLQSPRANVESLRDALIDLCEFGVPVQENLGN